VSTHQEWTTADNFLDSGPPGDTLTFSASSATSFPRIKVFQWATPRVMLAVTALSMVLHAVILLIDPKAGLASNILIGVAFLSVAFACLNQFQTGPVEARRLWAMLAAAFLISLIGQVQSTIDELLPSPHRYTAFTADFFFLTYGIPVLFAISSPNEDAGLRSFFWFDMAEAGIATLLLYLQIFASLAPFGGDPISSIKLMGLYNAENAILAVMVSVRLLARPAEGRKRFYDALCVYLWVYGFTALVLGYVELKLNWPQGLHDVAWALPILAFLVALVLLPGQREKSASGERGHSLAAVIDSLSPVLFILSIVIMGVRIAPQHRLIGLTSIAAAVTLYGLRSAFLQGKYMQSQRELSKSSVALLHAVGQLREQSIRDGLTGVHNRRHFDQELLSEWKRSYRSHLPLSLLLIDIDLFKDLNDCFGHLEGDDCLKKIAQRLAGQLRRTGDMIARYGGEEFSVILPDTPLQGAIEIAESMRNAVAALQIPNPSSTANGVITISIGVSSSAATSGVSLEDFLKTVDSALYRAKRRGRNCVESA
jgi:diguanylate cyclase (GGDEF)-like protein